MTVLSMPTLMLGGTRAAEYGSHEGITSRHPWQNPGRGGTCSDARTVHWGLGCAILTALQSGGPLAGGVGWPAATMAVDGATGKDFHGTADPTHTHPERARRRTPRDGAGGGCVRARRKSPQGRSCPRASSRNDAGQAVVIFPLRVAAA